MFWAMMYLLFFNASGAAPELSLIPEETIYRNAIADPQRLEQVLSIRGEVKAEEELFAEVLNNLYAEFARLSQQYETEADSFTIFFADLDSRRLSAQAALLDQRFRLKEQMTIEEWEKVYGRR